MLVGMSERLLYHIRSAACARHCMYQEALRYLAQESSEVRGSDVIEYPPKRAKPVNEDIELEFRADGLPRW